MTSPSSPPKRRRRRWPIVALLFVTVSAVAWWYWPRGDARFVGKWEMIEDYPFGIIHFYRNGSYRFWDVDQTSEDGIWRAEGKHLYLSEKSSLSELIENEFLWQAAVQVEAWTGYQGYTHYKVKPLEIASVSLNEIKLKATRAPSKSKFYREQLYTYRRIPE